MITLVLGLGALALLLWAANAFSRADVSSVKAALGWVAALAGLSLGAMLLLTGRGATALGALVLLGPLAWSWWQEGRASLGGRAAPGARSARGGPRMSRAEALQVLGLQDGATEADVREAWVRLMRTAHPDQGGSDWLAARINQARDVLLKRR